MHSAVRKSSTRRPLVLWAWIPLPIAVSARAPNLLGDPHTVTVTVAPPRLLSSPARPRSTRRSIRWRRIKSPPLIHRPAMAQRVSVPGCGINIDDRVDHLHAVCDGHLHGHSERHQRGWYRHANSDGDGEQSQSNDHIRRTNKPDVHQSGFVHFQSRRRVHPLALLSCTAHSRRAFAPM